MRHLKSHENSKTRSMTVILSAQDHIGHIWTCSGYPRRRGQFMTWTKTHHVIEVKNGIESNLGENYCAVVPTSVPRLKIVGMSDQYSSDVFIDLLKSQNEDIEIKDVKVVDMFENPRFTYNKYCVVIEVDLDSYKCLLGAKQVNVGFDRCSVYRAIHILRCFKCGEFGHKSADCKNCDRCSRCSHQHKTSECTSTVLKCVNCLKMNKERK